MTAEQRRNEPPGVTLEKMLKDEGLLEDGQKPEDVLISRGGGQVAMSAGADPTDYADVAAAAKAWAEQGTESPWFKRWFGDSKMVDEKGKPLMVYHGTNKSFDEFKTKGHEYQRVSGAYFTKNKSEASKNLYAGGEGGRVLPVYLKIKNPATRNVLDEIGYKLSGEEVRQELIRRGYDGLIDEYMDEIVVFDPTQIKSATGNRGTFDPTDPSILKAVAPVAVSGAAIAPILKRSHDREYKTKDGGRILKQSH